MIARWYLLMTIPALVGGCSNLGPDTLYRDRLGYNQAVADSWKEQTLLNIVKLRYADMPLFMDVASIVSGYTLEQTINLNGTLSSPAAVQGDFLSLGGSGRYTDRPTVTYAPLTGGQFNKSFMTPIPPTAILFMMQSGWPVDVIFPLAVDSINGLRSRQEQGVNQREGDWGYYRIITLFREIQQSGLIGMRIVEDETGKNTTVLFLYQDGLSPDIEVKMDELRTLLNLKDNDGEIGVSYGLIPDGDAELAMLTRSTLQVMIRLAQFVDVPETHLGEGRALSGLDPLERPPDELDALIEIRSSRERPDNAFVAVRYQDYWFSIRHGDFRSKSTLALLMLLFSLTETGGKEGLPLVTIPAG